LLIAGEDRSSIKPVDRLGALPTTTGALPTLVVEAGVEVEVAAAG